MSDHETEELTRTLQRIAVRIAELPGLPWTEDPAFRRIVSSRLHAVAKQLAEMASGELVFSGTESWRAVYKEVLLGCQLKRYWSTALVRTDHYWQDRPGKQSIEFNYRLVEKGFDVRRCFILDDFFWPPDCRLPDKDLHRWIDEHTAHGIEVSLLRASDLRHEPSLLRDEGIYGDRAVGRQVVDEDGRTETYILSFDRAAVDDAVSRWHALQLFENPPLR